MKSFLAAIILLTGVSALAQHSTLRFTDEPINLTNQSLLIIPLERMMYISDINKDLALANDLSSEEILNRFSTAIAYIDNLIESKN